MPLKLKIFKKAAKILFRNLFQCIAVIFPIIFMAVCFYILQIATTKYIKQSGFDISSIVFFADNRFIISFLPVIFSVLFIIISSPLYYGIFLWFIELSKNNRHCFYEIFGYYTSPKLFFRCIMFKLRIATGKAILLIPCLILLSVSLFVFEIIFDYSGKTAFMLITLCLCLLSLSVVLFISFLILSGKYIAAEYIFVTNPFIKAKSVMKQSKSVVYGFKTNILFFGVCLFPAAVLCLLVTPLFFVIPFVAICFSLYVSEIRNKTACKSI